MMNKLIIGILILGNFTIWGCSKNEFTLIDGNDTATIVIQENEASYVDKAVNDLISDIKKITGKEITIHDEKDPDHPNVVIGTVGKSKLLPDDEDFQNLEGKWESYAIKTKGSDLIIAGSNPRGTMFGIYHFIEKHLGVDPMYFWSDREPEKRDQLTWEDIDLIQDEPTFKYRGFFINDEDLLVHWKESEGRRYLEYYHYHQVTNAEVMGEVVEAAIRSRYNMIIPASFIDIKNPPEKKLVDVAVNRGMFVSMHHIEPLGVGGYKYANYWEKRGEDPKFSYYSAPEKLEQIWHDYAEDWSQYGDQVIWQLGLRGIADRPMWAADPSVPQSNEDRGEIISEAMEVQKEIVKEVDNRENPVMTTTLWMEGASLHNQGHLKFPENVHVIFSDNSPGWKWQEDFYNVEKDPERNYGIYYHHQLWGSGPHLVQGVSPWKTHSLYKEAVENNSHWYAINNVSNIRTFILGITATGKMMYNFNEFDPATFFQQWCEENFGEGAAEAEQAYREYFDSFVIDDQGEVVSGERSNTPMWLDGLVLGRIKGLLRSLDDKLEEGGAHLLDEDEKSTMEYYLDKLREQKHLLESSKETAAKAAKEMNHEDKRFFRQNLISHQKIMHGLTTWLEPVILAHFALEEGDIEQAADELLKAEYAIKEIREGQMINTRGEKWKWWYWGDRKMDIDSGKELWKSVLIKAQRNI